VWGPGSSASHSMLARRTRTSSWYPDSLLIECVADEAKGGSSEPHPGRQTHSTDQSPLLDGGFSVQRMYFFAEASLCHLI
jgi:hypothetical protein